MDANEFIDELVSSYPAGLRPDVDFLKVIQKEIRKKPVTSQVFEEVLTIIRNSFRMFPVISDINFAFDEAFKKVSRGAQTEKAWEYFDLDGYSYRRDVDIGTGGELLRKPVPCGATNYHLSVPAGMEADRQFLTAEEAYAEGCISEELWKTIKAPNTKQPYKGRFEKIGALIHKEEQPELSVDDSMAANPEEPVPIDPFGDI